MNQPALPTAPVPLWPGPAPGAHGTGPEDVPRLTPFLRATPAPHSAMIVCPGGGYTHRAAHEGAPVARWLNTLAIAAFVLDYRVAPYRHPAPLRDAQRALRYVRAHAVQFQIDPHRVGVLGFSAGGHLAATLATHADAGDPQAADPLERPSCRPDLLVLGYPVITFGPYQHPGSRQSLLGDAPAAELVQRLSAETQVTPTTPPTFLWHTADDAEVPVENSLLLAQALSAQRVPFELHVFPQGRHGLGLAEQDRHVGAWTQLCAAWLARYGFGHGGAATG